MAYQIITGDNRHTLKNLPDNSIDSIVTDPPYGIDFLGKAWDANTGALETYQECLRVLKPGGHILAFSAARTYHHLAVTLEQAGFEIRDQLMWIYSSGFPKSQDVGRSIQRSLGVKETKAQKGYNGFGSENGTAFTQDWDRGPEKNPQVVCSDPVAKQWEGWGTALKPAHEPIALARKPIKLSIARNCQTHGVGALNIDACRVPYESEDDYDTYINNLKGPMERSTAQDGDGLGMFEGKTGFKAQKGKVVKSTKPKIGTMGKAPPNLNAIGTPSTIETSDQPWVPSDAGRFPSNVLGDIPDYQKYFYCPKVSRAERHMGFDDDTVPVHWDMVSAMGGYYLDDKGNRDDDRAFGGKNIYLPHKGMIYGHGLKHEYAEWCKTNNKTPIVGNNHPTVKPIELMKYLIKLVTPAGGTVLDPFCGSGSTGCAAVELGHTFIGCELDPNYVEIAQRRIRAWHEHTQDPTTFNNLFSIED